MGALNFCEGCGIQINPDSRFCKSCSKKMTEKPYIPEIPKVHDPFSDNNEKTAASEESYTQVVDKPLDSLSTDTNSDTENVKNNEKNTSKDESYTQTSDEHWDSFDADINSEPFQEPSVEKEDLSKNEIAFYSVPEDTSNTTEPISAFKALRKIAKVLFIFIVSVLFFVSGIIIFFFWWLYSEVENQNSGIRNQLEALRIGKIEKAYSYMSKDFQANIPLGTFPFFLNAYPQLTTNESQSFITNSQHGDLGKVIAKLKSKGGVETQVEYHLKKEDGEWKIVSIKVLP